MPADTTPQHLPYRNLPQLLLRAREMVLSHFRPIITHFGLTEQQWRIIRAVSEAGEMEQRDIGETCQILSPSLTGVLARMEESGLVLRQRHAEDQRRMLVRLTPRAEQLVEDMRPFVVAQYHAIEEAYGPELIRDIYTVMDRVMALSDTPVRQVLPERQGTPERVPAE